MPSAAIWIRWVFNRIKKRTDQTVLISLLATVITFLICAALGFVLVLGMIAGSM